MNIDEAVEFFGNQTKLANALGIATNSASNWKARGNAIPLPVQWQIELATKSLLIADVKPHMLGDKEIATLRHSHRMKHWNLSGE
jgi:DNA-binding transcriptional regulator YdaS (Cro superfamily)